MADIAKWPSTGVVSVYSLHNTESKWLCPLPRQRVIKLQGLCQSDKGKVLFLCSFDLHFSYYKWKWTWKKCLRGIFTNSFPWELFFCVLHSFFIALLSFYTNLHIFSLNIGSNYQNENVHIKFRSYGRE